MKKFIYIIIVAIVVSSVSNLSAQNADPEALAKEYNFSQDKSYEIHAEQQRRTHVKANKKGVQDSRALWGVKVGGGATLNLDGGFGGKAIVEIESPWGVSLGTDLGITAQNKFKIFDGTTAKGNSYNFTIYAGIDPVKIANPRLPFGFLLMAGIRADHYKFNSTMTLDGFYNAEGNAILIGQKVEHNNTPVDAFFGVRAHYRVAKNVEISGSFGMSSHKIDDIYYDQNGGKIDHSINPKVKEVSFQLTYRF